MSIVSVQRSGRQHETALVPHLIKSVGVVGSRSLPYSLADKVGLITEDLIKRKYHIATGGAIGERGIRTPGAFRLNGFQDRRNRPLCHLSMGKCINCLVRL